MVVRVVRQAGVAHPGHLGLLLKEAGHRHGVLAVTVHAHVQGLDALEDEEAVKGRDGGAHVAQRHHPRPADVGRRAQGLGVDHAVVGDIGFVEPTEARLVLGPGELAGVHQGAADGGAVATQVLGEGMDDDVGAMLEGPAQIGGGHRVVDDQGDAVGMSHVGHGADVGDIACRVADGLAEDRLGALIDQGRHARDVVGGGEADLDAELRQGVGEEVIGAAIEGRSGDDVVAALANGEEGVGHRRHARGQGQAADAALQGRQPLFQHVAGGIHDAGVDVARHFEVEQVRPVLGVIEGVGGGLVNRGGDGVGSRVRLKAGVDGQGLDLHGVSWWGMDGAAVLVLGRHLSGNFHQGVSTLPR